MTQQIASDWQTEFVRGITAELRGYAAAVARDDYIKRIDTERAKQVRAEGAKAFADGVPFTDNPYSPTVGDHQDFGRWQRGWIDAELALKRSKPA